MEKSINFLKKETVYVKPRIKQGWLGKHHAASVMFDGCKVGVTVPIGPNGDLLEVLTKEEKEFFETPVFGFKPGELSNRAPFWKNFTVRLEKPVEGVLTEDMVILTLDLSKWEDYFKLKVLELNTSVKGMIAPSEDKKNASANYKFYLVKEGSEDEFKTVKLDKEKTVRKYIYSIDNSREKLFELLYVLYLEDPKGTEPPLDATIEWLRVEIEKKLNSKLDLLTSIVKDEKSYPVKVLVYQAIKKNILRYDRINGVVNDKDKPLGYTLQQAVNYLTDARNQADLIRLQGQLELTK